MNTQERRVLFTITKYQKYWVIWKVSAVFEVYILKYVLYNKI